MQEGSIFTISSEIVWMKFVSPSPSIPSNKPGFVQNCPDPKVIEPA